RVVVVPGRLVVTGAGEGVAQHLFLSYARGGVAERSARRQRHLLAVLLRHVLESANLIPGIAPGKSISSTSRPHLSFTTAFCPPMVFAEPWSTLIVVTPPASWR